MGTKFPHQCATIVGLLVLLQSTSAAVLTMDYAFEFSGAYPPVGAAPWLRATLDDGGSPGTVELTFEALNLSSTEFVFETNFNLDPSLNPTDLVFSAPVKTGTFTDPVVGLGTDAFQADGDGLYDIMVKFNNGGGSNGRFGASEAVSYTISGIAGLTAASFDYLSTPAGGHGPYLVAAHVGGVDDVNSGWVTTPEPASLMLILLGASLIRRR